LAEEAWISWHFTQACKDAGVKVYRQVEVEGYLDSQTLKKRSSVNVGSHDIPQTLEFESSGYRFYEQELTDGGVSHQERVDGQLVVSIREHPMARYRLAYAYQPTPYKIEEPLGWQLWKTERQVIDNQTGEILGRDTHITRVLPMYEQVIVGLFGPPLVSCPKPYPFTRQQQLQQQQQVSKQNFFPYTILKPVYK